MGILLKPEEHPLISEQEELQIRAAKLGATPEETSLGGRLPPVHMLSSRVGTLADEQQTIVEEEAFADQTTATNQQGQQSPTDILLGEGSQNVHETLANKPVSVSTGFLSKRALDLTRIKAMTNPLDDREQMYRESFAELSGGASTEEVFERYQQEAASTMSADQLQAIEQSVKQEGELFDPEQAMQDLTVATTLPEKYSGLLGEQLLNQDLYAPTSLSEGVKNELAASDFKWAVLEQYSESIGFFDKWGSSLFGLLFLPDFIKDANDLIGGDLLKTGKDLNKLIQSYQQLPAQLKPAAFIEIFEKAVPAFEGNIWKISGLISLLDSQEYHSDITAEVALATADTISLGLALTPLRVIRGLTRMSRTSAKLKKTRNAKAAAEDFVDGAENVHVAGDSTDRANTANPWNMENEVPGAGSIDGMSADIIRRRDEISEAVARDVVTPMRELQKDDSYIEIGSLTTVEKDAAVEKYLARVGKKADKDKVLFTNAKLVGSDDAGFTVEYKLDGIPQKEVREWKLSDAGTFEMNNPTFMESNVPGRLTRFFQSAENKLSTVDPDLVANTTFGGLQASTLQQRLTKIALNINEGVPRKSRLAVDELLIAGDAYRDANNKRGKVFSLTELESGTINVGSGMRSYDRTEIEHYYKKVALNQELWKFRNALIHQELTFRGAKALKTASPDVEGEFVDTLVIPKEDFKNVELNKEDFIYAPQLTDGGYITGNQAAARLTTYKEEGYKPAKLVQPYSIGNKKVTWALIKDEGEEGSAHLAELPREVLNKQEGYVAGIYKPGYYFVKANGRTLVAAKSLREANDWIKNFNIQQDIDEVPAKDRLNPEPFRDRQLDKFESLVEDAHQYGGLYDGARSRAELVDTDGEALQRLDWSDSTQRYINAISEEMPLNKYKITLIERFNKSVNDIMKKENPDKHWAPADWRTDSLSGITDAKTRVAMEEARNYLLTQFKISTADEKIWNNIMMDVAENLEGKEGTNAFQRTAITLAHKDPINQMRGATFNTMMGWFNPRHLYIQMQNASLAIGIDPKNAVKNTLKSSMMATMINLSPDNVVSWANKYSKMPGAPSATELIDEVTAFKRAGMQSSILRNADIQATTGGLTGGTVDQVRKVAKKGLTFYEYGETVSRITAWNIAKSRWRETNPESDFNDKALQEVTREAFRININMQKENAASFQSNAWTANALQFLQVQAKFTEKTVKGLMGRGDPSVGGWTREEASRVVAAQLFMYGAVGVPIVEDATAYAMDFLGTDPIQMKQNHPFFQETINDGFLGGIMELAGFENSFGGDTASLLASFDNNIIYELGKQAVDAFAGREPDEVEFSEAVVGPSLTFAKRGSDLILGMYDGLKTLYRTPNLETLGEVSSESFFDLLSLTSTWSNAEKQLMAKSLGGVRDNNNNLVLSNKQLSELSLGTRVAMAGGLPADLYTANYNLQQGGKDRQKYMTKVKNSLKQAQLIYLQGGNKNRLHSTVAYLTTGLSPLEKRDVMSAVHKDVLRETTKTQLDKQVGTLTRNMIRAGGKLVIPLSAGDLPLKETK